MANGVGWYLGGMTGWFWICVAIAWAFAVQVTREEFADKKDRAKFYGRSLGWRDRLECVWMCWLPSFCFLMLWFWVFGAQAGLKWVE